MPALLLLLPVETYRAADFIDAAARVGTEVIVGAPRRQALAGAMGDRALVLDLRRPEQAAARIVAHAARTPIDGIVAVDDQGVVAATIAAERLGLPHNPLDAVAASRDKALLRRRLAAAGLPQPDFRELRPGEAPAGELAAGEAPAGDPVLEAAAVEAARAVGFPCVLKPVALSASRGVIRADDEAAVRAAARRIDALLCDEDPGERRQLVERFVPGPEVAVEGLLRDGALEILAVFDKPDPLDGPFFEETIYVTPSRSGRVPEIEAALRAAVAALGLREGPIHAELRLPAHAPVVLGSRKGSQGGASEGSPEAPVVLEVAARSIGGLCARSLRFGLDVGLEDLLIRHALGLPLEDARREHAASGVMMLPIPSAGRLVGIGGQDAARAVPGITGLEITVPPGSAVVPLPEGDRYLGFLFARGFDPGEVEAALRAAHARLEIEIQSGSAA